MSKTSPLVFTAKPSVSALKPIVTVMIKVLVWCLTVVFALPPVPLCLKNHSRLLFLAERSLTPPYKKEKEKPYLTQHDSGVLLPHCVSLCVRVAVRSWNCRSMTQSAL